MPVISQFTAGVGEVFFKHRAVVEDRSGLQNSPNKATFIRREFFYFHQIEKIIKLIKLKYCIEGEEVTRREVSQDTAVHLTLQGQNDDPKTIQKLWD